MNGRLGTAGLIDVDGSAADDEKTEGIAMELSDLALTEDAAGLDEGKPLAAVMNDRLGTAGLIDLD